MKQAGVTLSQGLGLLLVSIVVLPEISLAAENQPPTATVKTVKLNEDVKTTVTLSGQDPERKKLSYALVSQPAHGAVSLKGSEVT